MQLHRLHQAVLTQPLLDTPDCMGRGKTLRAVFHLDLNVSDLERAVDIIKEKLQQQLRVHLLLLDLEWQQCSC